MVELLADLSGERLAELHWRIAVPLGVLVLAVVAVPLSRTQPRAGRYGRVALGVLVYLLYTNMLTAGRLWLERGVIPEWLGLWWVHGLVLALGVTLLAREQGWARRAPAAPRLQAQPA
jgi:lipopolysaccharide export system permease protein